MRLWKHQQYCVDRLSELINDGERNILVTSPTGGGKTEIMFAIVAWGFPCVFYLHRRALLDQFAERLTAAGFSFGVRAGDNDPRLLEDIQLSMIQTDYSRCIKKKRWSLHQAKIVFVDEAHDQKAEMAQSILDEHRRSDDAVVIGMTATPLGLGGIYDKLIVAGDNTSLRECGALLPSTTYAPNEPDTRKLKTSADGTIADNQVNKHAKTILTGNILKHWKRHNPDALPTIGFACSCDTSLGHAKEFAKAGISAAHIDGEDTWIDGKWYFTDTEARRHLKEACKSGEIKVVWNRFILREGVDWPFLYCGLFATIFRSLTAYIQAGGRVLRNHETLDHVIFCDFGGNWWRYGGLNGDRSWELGDTHRTVTGKRDRRLREKKDPEPYTCRKCDAMRLWGRECPECGHVERRRSRTVVTANGKLREVTGDIFKARRTTTDGGKEKVWERVYWRAHRTGMSFEQAIALFALENNWFYPADSYKLMPKREDDWFRKVRDVPQRNLTSGRKDNKTTEVQGQLVGVGDGDGDV